MSQRRKTGDPKTAVAYIRVSTDEQRLGTAAQRTDIEAWAAREGVTVAAWQTDEGVSGASPIERRAGLCNALVALRDCGAGMLAVAKRDRIARDVVIAATIERAATANGARLVSADGTANGESPADDFMRTVIDGAAAYERGLIRARTKAALQAKRERGERVGSIPFGFRLADDGVHLEADEHEQVVVERVRVLSEAGRSTRAVVIALSEDGLVNPRTARKLNQTQVVRILRAVEAGRTAA